MVFSASPSNQLLWRNRLARSAVNRKVASSSLARSGEFLFLVFEFFSFVFSLALLLDHLLFTIPEHFNLFGSRKLRFLKVNQI